MKFYKVLFSYFIIITLTWIILLFVNHLNPYSKFHHYEVNFEKYRKNYRNLEQSAERAKNELKNWFFKTQNSSNLLFDYKNAKYLCMGIISKKRVGYNQNNYVQQAVMSILSRVSFKRQDKLRIVAFNMDLRPEENEQLLQFNGLIRIVNMSSNLTHPKPRVKEALDYSLVLEYFSKLKCTYSILSEDDSIFVQNWFEILFKNLQTSKKLDLNDWLMCKLFSGYKFFDHNWLFALNFWITLKFFLTFISILSFNMFVYFLINRKKTKFQYFYLIILLINGLIQTWFFISTSISPEGHGFHYYWTGFGSVSILYPFRSLSPLALFISDVVKCYANESSNFFQAKDLLIDLFREKNKLKEVIFVPSLVQHTGIHSSLMLKDISSVGFKHMYKSFSFMDDYKLIEFNKSN